MVFINKMKIPQIPPVTFRSSILQYISIYIGNYIYLKTGFSTKEGTKASIQSRRLPKIHYNSAACYNFWYHLMGDNIGTINIYKLEVTLYSKSKPVLLWTKSGDQGSNWNHGRFTVTPSRMRYYKGYQVRSAHSVSKFPFARHQLTLRLFPTASPNNSHFASFGATLDQRPPSSI